MFDISRLTPQMVDFVIGNPQAAGATNESSDQLIDALKVSEKFLAKARRVLYSVRTHSGQDLETDILSTCSVMIHLGMLLQAHLSETEQLEELHNK